MTQAHNPSAAHGCPMHGEIRQAGPGACPRCGMPLVPAGARVALLRHLAGNPRMLAVMAVAMLVVMAAAMMVAH